MKSNISNILDISKDIISIKATTNEKIGLIGKGEGIAAESIVSIERHKDARKLANRNLNTIFAIIKGGLVSKNNKLVLSPGDVVRTETIKRLTEVFKLTDFIDILSVSEYNE
mgnify:CR=1 FL=1